MKIDYLNINSLDFYEILLFSPLTDIYSIKKVTIDWLLLFIKTK